MGQAANQRYPILGIGLKAKVLGHLRGLELRNQEKGRRKLAGGAENRRQPWDTDAKPRPSSTGGRALSCFALLMKRWITLYLNTPNAYKMKRVGCPDCEAQMIFKTLRDLRTLIKTVKMTSTESKWQWTPTRCNGCFGLWFIEFTGRWP